MQIFIAKNYFMVFYHFTNWGRVAHICAGNLTIIASVNGFGRCQAIILSNAGILLIRPLGINFNENLIEIHTS